MPSIGRALLLVDSHVSALNTSALATNVLRSEGVTNSSNPEAICTRASWFTVAIFILANYVAHATTTQTFPGEKLSEQAVTTITSLLYPGAGVMRGLNCIARGILVLRCRFRKDTELQQAAAAGALCMVIRTEDWTPPSQCLVHGAKFSSSESSGARPWKVYTPPWLQPPQFCEGWAFVDGVSGNYEKSRTIHGALKKLPKGYAYMPVPPEAIVEPLVPECTVHLSKSLNTVKIFASIFQAIYSFYTLVQDSHYQVQHFGFAAFPLTVAPYTIMSIVNLFGSLLFPVYPAVFLIQSEVSVEVEQRHGKMFDGMVGSLKLSEDNPIMFVMQDQVTEDMPSAVVLDPTAPSDDSDDLVVSIPTFPPFQYMEPLSSGPIFSRAPQSISPPIQHTPSRLPTFFSPPETILKHVALIYLSYIIALGLPIAIIGCLSSFKVGRSTIAQRVWVMMWLVFGALYGTFFALTDIWEEHLESYFGRLAFSAIGRLGVSAPAIGGFVVVAQMISAYGECKRLS